MRDRRTWLGLVVAILTVVVIWWQQGDAGTTTEDPQAGPTASQSTSEAPGLPSPSDTGPASDLPVVAAADLPPEAQDTLALIDAGGPYPDDAGRRDVREPRGDPSRPAGGLLPGVHRPDPRLRRPRGTPDRHRLER